MPHYRQPLSFSSELATLDFLIRHVHTSLETLVLPAECAPIHTMSSLHWPLIREFTLRGERWTDPATPIVSLFSSMPSLRIFALELSEPKNAHVDARMVWPKELSTPFPWPDLESFHVSHPDPADQNYPHLPASLHTLALRAWPHQCLRIFADIHMPLYPSPWEGPRQASTHRWSSFPITPARDLAQIVRKCDLPQLRVLELEYASDTEEPELLRLAVMKFPHLTVLQIHRCRSPGSGGVKAKDLAHALAPLASLRTLKLYVDFAEPDDPQPRRFMPVAASTETLSAAANQLARSLATSLQEIWIFEHGLMWSIFRVSCAGSGGRLYAHAYRDSAVLVGRC
ncbi:hypothetical protein V8D89_001763 [Ganoderma adspersum]